MLQESRNILLHLHLFKFINDLDISMILQIYFTIFYENETFRKTGCSIVKKNNIHIMETF